MSTRTIAVVFLALFCGCSLAFGAILVSRNKTTVSVGSKAATATVPVVVAAVDIPRGRKVTAEDLELREWPKDLCPPGALSEIKAAVDRAAFGQVVKGEPLLETKLSSMNAKGGLPLLITVGMRAYTIQTSRVAANVAGFIMPDDCVDVLLNLRGTTRGEDLTGGGSTTTLLQAVKVLAVDQILGEPEDKEVASEESSSVTLMVTPDQAAKLDLGSNMGVLSLSLRNPEDTQPAVTEPATITQIRYMLGMPTVIPDDEPRPPAPVAAAADNVPDSSLIAVKPRAMSIVTFRGPHRGRVLVTERQDGL